MNIEQTISLYLDGELTSEQEAEFHHLLSVSPEARSLFREHMALQSIARDEQTLLAPEEGLRNALFGKLAAEGMAVAAMPAGVSATSLSEATLTMPAEETISSREPDFVVPAADPLTPGRRGSKRSAASESRPARARGEGEEEEKKRRRLVPFLVPFLLMAVAGSILWFGRDGTGTITSSEVPAIAETIAPAEETRAATPGADRADESTGTVETEGLSVPTPAATSSTTISDRDRPAARRSVANTTADAPRPARNVEAAPREMAALALPSSPAALDIEPDRASPPPTPPVAAMSVASDDGESDGLLSSIPLADEESEELLVDGGYGIPVDSYFADADAESVENFAVIIEHNDTPEYESDEEGNFYDRDRVRMEEDLSDYPTSFVNAEPAPPTHTAEENAAFFAQYTSVAPQRDLPAPTFTSVGFGAPQGPNLEGSSYVARMTDPEGKPIVATVENQEEILNYLRAQGIMVGEDGTYSIYKPTTERTLAIDTDESVTVEAPADAVAMEKSSVTPEAATTSTASNNGGIRGSRSTETAVRRERIGPEEDPTSIPGRSSEPRSKVFLALEGELLAGVGGSTRTLASYFESPTVNTGDIVTDIMLKAGFAIDDRKEGLMLLAVAGLAEYGDRRTTYNNVSAAPIPPVSENSVESARELWLGTGGRYMVALGSNLGLGAEVILGVGEKRFHAGVALPVTITLSKRLGFEIVPSLRYRNAHAPIVPTTGTSTFETTLNGPSEDEELSVGTGFGVLFFLY